MSLKKLKLTKANKEIHINWWMFSFRNKMWNFLKIQMEICLNDFFKTICFIFIFKNFLVDLSQESFIKRNKSVGVLNKTRTFLHIPEEKNLSSLSCFFLSFRIFVAILFHPVTGVITCQASSCCLNISRSVSSASNCTAPAGIQQCH